MWRLYRSIPSINQFRPYLFELGEICVMEYMCVRLEDKLIPFNIHSPNRSWWRASLSSLFCISLDLNVFSALLSAFHAQPLLATCLHLEFVQRETDNALRLKEKNLGTWTLEEFSRSWMEKQEHQLHYEWHSRQPQAKSINIPALNTVLFRLLKLGYWWYTIRMNDTLE